MQKTSARCSACPIDLAWREPQGISCALRPCQPLETDMVPACSSNHVNPAHPAPPTRISTPYPVLTWDVLPVADGEPVEQRQHAHLPQPALLVVVAGHQRAEHLHSVRSAHSTAPSPRAAASTTSSPARAHQQLLLPAVSATASEQRMWCRPTSSHAEPAPRPARFSATELKTLQEAPHVPTPTHSPI